MHVMSLALLVPPAATRVCTLPVSLTPADAGFVALVVCSCYSLHNSCVLTPLLYGMLVSPCSSTVEAWLRGCAVNQMAVTGRGNHGHLLRAAPAVCPGPPAAAVAAVGPSV